MDISCRLRRMRGVHWLGVYGVILAGWAMLFAMQMPADLRAASSFYGPGFWQALCIVTPGIAGVPTVFAMWAAMTAAMMAPTFLPTLATYDDLVQGGAAPGFLNLAAGYLAVWLGFAVIATVAQFGLAGLGLIDPLAGSTSKWFTVALLAGTGAYQFSRLKAGCLSKCRRPMVFFMQHWDEGPLRMGLRLGALCLGCCWALMALAFVGGTMNLAWMGVTMVLMTLEKLPELGARLTRPIGYGLLAAAVFAAVM